ncbi:energy transducer TonB [uncultured Phascolarctobacterium sp.]|jgi:protein TonB|uniref:energy transducer TonB n=1 Tax=uncultured Phascolarctobacterium sp. TaxID=512296 RepID=UPI0025E55D41|nr:energy transducer TonB [uncultured Phascolarctobacterium sp.]
MKDEQQRFGKGLAVALALHLVVAAGLGFFGYHFTQTPPEILEVTLAGGGGGEQAEEEEIEQEEQQEQEEVIEDKEDIVDDKLKPKQEHKKKVVRKATSVPGPKSSAAKPGTGPGEGGGSGGGTGGGEGNAQGSGQGEGAGVPIRPPRLIRDAKPSYPASARNMGISGSVGVRVLVSADGVPESVTVVASSGNSAVDDSVVQAAYKWRFDPSRDKYGKKVRCNTRRTITFNLR